MALSSLRESVDEAVTEYAAPVGSRAATNNKMPRTPTPNVAELAARLYAAFQVDGGSMKLAGCTLEPQPIVHVVPQQPATVVEMDRSQSPAISMSDEKELFLTADGEVLDQRLVAELGLNDLAAFDKPPRLEKSELDRLTDIGRQYCKDDASQVEIVWCRFAAGKLRFTIGEQFADLPFADWAARLTASPWVCPASGNSTFHLASVDDGRIVAAEAVGKCEQSGRCVLENELVTCSESGKQVARQLTEVCPATRQPVLRELMVDCDVCGTRVSPKALKRKRCGLCQEMEVVATDDSRLAAIFGAYPGLNRWRRWKMAATPTRIVLEAAGAWRRLLVVLDSESHKVMQLAEGNRISRKWRDVPAERWAEFLQ
jgi:hypothetical protein